ncbi:hypothetical protein WJS89_10405 [Sphingomicrobium sp. XHP0235]|uniref:hypothetical protein n=1 Tax=Sphingomicrobium aquimarinum TaxID=3133971 RepID=UPI0031FE8EC5
MTGMIHKRGRNHWYSDGRPVGFGMPLERQHWLDDSKAWRWTTLAALIATFAIFILPHFAR